MSAFNRFLPTASKDQMAIHGFLCRSLTSLTYIHSIFISVLGPTINPTRFPDITTPDPTTPSIWYHSLSIQFLIILTVANIDATPYRTPSVSIQLVCVDNPQMHRYNSLKTQRNNRITPWLIRQGKGLAKTFCTIRLWYCDNRFLLVIKGYCGPAWSNTD